MQPAIFQLTQLLNNRYSIVEPIEQTVLESAYLARDSIQSDEFCIVHQLIAQSDDAASQMMSLYQSELSKLKSLRHPNILPIRDVFAERNSFCWVQDDAGRQNYRNHPVMGESDLIQWLKTMLLTLSYLHSQGVTHCNLAPETIVISSRDRSPLLTNFSVFEDIRKALGIVPAELMMRDRIQQFPISAPSSKTAEDLYGLGLAAAILLTGKELGALFNMQSQSWDWEQWKCLSDSATQVLNRLVSVQHSFASANEAYQLLAMPSPTLQPLSQPPIYQPPQSSFPSIHAMSTQMVPTEVAVQLSSDNKVWLMALGGGILLTLVGILAVVLARGNGQSQPAVVAVPSAPQSSTSTLSGSPNQSSTQQNQVSSASTVQSALPLSSSSQTSSSSQISSLSQTPTTSFSTPSNSLSSSALSKTAKLTEDEAVSLIRNWLQVKKSVFASPFDRQAAASLTTGTLYYDITKPGGSIDWLQGNNSYYQFGTQSVEPTGKFSAMGEQASVEVRVTEDKTFYVNGRIDASQTNNKTKTVRYSLQLENGTWKIADYK